MKISMTGAMSCRGRHVVETLDFRRGYPYRLGLMEHDFVKERNRKW